MLLVITITSDKTMNLVVDRVKKPVVRINIDENPMKPFSYSFDGKQFSNVYDGVNLEEVSSVWYRIAYLTYLKEKPGSFEMLNRLCREEMVNQLAGLLTAPLWVSNPFAIKRADNKQLQLKVAHSLGMTIPPTLVTTSRKDVEEFREINGDIVVKPFAKQVIRDNEQRLHAIFTNRIRKEQQIDYSLLSSSPAIFQQEIDREFDIRTVVVGNDVFSISIRQVGKKSGDVDYRDGRGKDLVYERYDLPRQTAEQCIQFVRNFNLMYSSMDFILGKNGVLYFLENNPCGAWVFVQNGGNHPISETLAKLLDT